MKICHRMSWMVLALVACHDPAAGADPAKQAAAPAKAGAATGKSAAMLNLLDQVKPFFNMDGGPLFKPAAMQELTALPDAEEQLLAVIRDTGQSLSRRFAAVEALAQGGWSKWRSTEADTRIIAHVLADAIPQDKIHNRWGLPGHFVGRTGKFLISLPHGADQVLVPLLKDQRALNIVGGETATVQESYHYRVSDLAAYLLATWRNVPWKDDKSPAARDAENQRLGGGSAP